LGISLATRAIRRSPGLPDQRGAGGLADSRAW
jgi:hypothetical protein